MKALLAVTSLQLRVARDIPVAEQVPFSAAAPASFDLDPRGAEHEPVINPSGNSSHPGQ